MGKLIEKNGYFYLQKAFRKNGKVVVKEEYLGKEIPKNVNKLMDKFDKKIRDERFLKDVLLIQKNFNKEFKSMPKVAQKKFLENFAVNFTYNTQAIEGSTLTLKDTLLLVQDGISPTKPIKDIDESREHYKLFLEMLGYRKELSHPLTFFWHKRLFEKSDFEIAGKERRHNVSVVGSKTVFPDHIEVGYLLDELFDWHKENKDKFNPVELAALIHLKFVSIHPFSDGNGRMSRLLMNYVLYQNDCPLIDIPYGDRRSYYNNLEKSQVKDDSNYFVEFIVKKFIKDYGKYS